MAEPELPEFARKILTAVVEIEDREIAVARAGGCRCSKPYPGTDRFYPLASFTTGTPLDAIPWEMRHEDGCPMDGQSGVG